MQRPDGRVSRGSFYKIKNRMIGIGIRIGGGSGVVVPNPSVNANKQRPFLILGSSIPRGTTTQFDDGAEPDYDNSVYQHTGGNIVEITTGDLAEALVGSFWPKWGDLYYKNTGIKPVFKNKAIGGSEFAASGDNNNWSTTGTLYAAMVPDANDCLADLEVTRFGGIFIDGPINDARYVLYNEAATSAATDSLITRLKADFPNTPIYFINIGRDETGTNTVKQNSVRALIDALPGRFTSVYVVDSLNNYIDPALNAYDIDQIHLTQFGNELVATNVFKNMVDDGHISVNKITRTITPAIQTVLDRFTGTLTSFEEEKIIDLVHFLERKSFLTSVNAFHFGMLSDPLNAYQDWMSSRVASGGDVDVADGFITNGTDFINTDFVPSTDMTTATNTGVEYFGFYKEYAGEGTLMGAIGSTSTNTVQLEKTIAGFDFATNSGTKSSYAFTHKNNLHVSPYRTSISNQSLRINANAPAAPAVAVTLRPDRELYVGALNNNGTDENHIAVKCPYFGVQTGTAAANTFRKFRGLYIDFMVLNPENVFSREEVLEVIDPSYGVTLNASNEATSIVGRKGILTLENADDTRYYQVVDFHGGKAFFRNNGTGFYTTAQPLTQKYFSAIALHYQTLASPVFFLNRNNATSIAFRHVSNVVTINTTSIVGVQNMGVTNDPELRTSYWEYNSNGLAVGADGFKDNSNATVVATTAPDLGMRFFNNAGNINGVQGYVGTIVFFNRALTVEELEFWSNYLKSTWYNGYRGKLPFNDSYDGNNFSWFTFNDFYNFQENSATARWYNNLDKSRWFNKGTNTYKIDNPHTGSTEVTTPYEFLTVDGANASITQAQAFTLYFLCNFHPAYKANVQRRQLFTNTQGADNICLYYDKVTGKIHMQGSGAIGTGGISLDYAPLNWAVVKAVFNGASSSLEIDGVAVTGDMGSLGLSGTSILANGSDVFMQGFGIYNGVPTSQIDTETKAFLNKIKLALPDYTKGVFINDGNDDFATYSRAFGGIARNGTTLYVTYRRGPTHVDLTGEIYFSKSTDNGTTFSLESAVTPFILNKDDRDPRIAVTNTGRLLINYFKRISGVVTTQVRYSDDEGATWSSEINCVPSAPNARNWLGTSGYIIQLGSGDLLLPYYGFNNPGNTDQINGVFRSTDNGLTWTDDSSFPNPNVGDSAFQEWNIRLLQNGTVLGLIRREVSSTREIWRTVGTVGTPMSWTTPVKAVDGFGSPGFIQATDGTLWMTNRYRTLNLWIQYQKSVDNGVTWTHEKFPEPHTDYWVYGAPIQLEDGRIAALFSVQNTASKAFCKFRILT